jgi:hypothetical protein
MFRHDSGGLFLPLLTVRILYTKLMWEREKSSCVKLFPKHNILMLHGVHQLLYSLTKLMPYVDAAIIGKFVTTPVFSLLPRALSKM